MILSFKPQFAPKILDGTKIHTIRDDKNNRWKEGLTAQMATGVRSKKYNCFKETEILKVYEIELYFWDGELNRFWIGCNHSDYHFSFHFRDRFSIEKLANNDGFESVEEMSKWFFPLSEDTQFENQKIYTGRLICWTDFDYYISYFDSINNSKLECKCTFDSAFNATI